MSGPGTVAFTNAHALTTEASSSERGLYVLRLAVNDGLLVIGDNIEIVVNCQPEVSAGNDREILLRDTEELVGSLLDSGLGDPSRGEIKLMWELVDGPGTVTFQHDKALRTQATFSKSGSYLLRLTADNDSIEASNEMVVSVAGRVTNSLQASMFSRKVRAIWCGMYPPSMHPCRSRYLMRGKCNGSMAVSR